MLSDPEILAPADPLGLVALLMNTTLIHIQLKEKYGKILIYTTDSSVVLLLFLHSELLVLDYRYFPSIFVALSAKYEVNTIFMGIAQFTSISLHFSNPISINSV